MKNGVNEMLNDFMKNIDVVSQTQKVIGEEMVTSDGTVIIPVSKVSMGFGGGGSEFGAKAEPNTGGGVAGGVKVSPEAFLVISGGNVRLIPIGGTSTPLDKAIDMIPGLIDKVNTMFIKKHQDKENTIDND